MTQAKVFAFKNKNIQFPLIPQFCRLNKSELIFRDIEKKLHPLKFR